MTVLPASKYNEFVKKLNSFPVDVPATRFEVAEIKRESENLKKAGFLGRAFSLEGMLASVQHEVDEMRRCHDKAITFDSDRVLAYSSYAISLRRLGLNSEALSKAKKAYEIAPDAYDALELLVYLAVDSGRLRDASNWLDKLSKAHPGKFDDEYVDWLRANWVPAIEGAKLADDDIATNIDVAVNLARERGYTPLRFIQFPKRDHEDGSFIFETIVVLNEHNDDKVADLNFDLAVKRSETDTAPMVASSVVVRFSGGNDGGQP